MNLPAEPGLQQAVAVRCAVGESPLWHPREQVLYWCDIPAQRLYRHDPASGAVSHWEFETDVACCAAMLDGSLLLAMRSGLWRFDPRDAALERLASAPYDQAKERFNDGKCDPRGRFWSGTIYEPHDLPVAALYCFHAGQLRRMAGELTVSNGLGWSPDGRTMYLSDTPAHRIDAFDFDPATGRLSRRRCFAQFEPRTAGQPITAYGGRPDGAAVDSEGCYWVAMFEGARVLRLSPEGQVLREVRLPVRCATMPCFGGADLRTLYITTATQERSADELAAQPWTGSVLALRVDVAGLPTHLFER